MNYWFGDHTGFRSQKDSRKPDIFILGGLLISKNELDKVKAIFHDIKSRYTHVNMPVKWNMRDLKNKYEEFDRADQYKKLLKDSASWRKELISRLDEIDYVINLSCIENFQKKSKDKDLKHELIRYAFSNILMRIGYIIKRKKKECTVVMDWPDKQNSKPYNREYYSAFNQAKSADGRVEYYCGKLSDLKFNDCVLFANMNHSIGLQLADIIIGAFRDGIKSFREGHHENLGKELTQLYLPKVNGYSKNLTRYGIVVSNKNKEFQKFLNKYVEHLLQN